MEAVETKREPADLGDEASKAQKDQAQEEQHAGEAVAPQKDQAVGKAEAQKDQALGKVASVKKKPARTDSQFGFTEQLPCELFGRVTWPGDLVQ